MQTNRLSLRRWTSDDVPAFLDLYGREEVARWLGPQPRRPVASEQEARARLERWARREAGLEPPLGLWAMLLRDGSRPGPIGTVLLLPLEEASGPTDQVEVGWHLHPQLHGCGLATEAAGVLLQAAAASGIGAVLALTDPDNVRSAAVARRLGMQDDGPTDRWFGLTMRQFRLVLDATGPGPGG